MSEELRSIPPQQGSFVFTSESVTEGHPDKIADQISDAVLDAILAKEIELQEQGYIAPNGVPANVENVRCACETLVTTGTVIVAGEIRTQAYVDVQEIARGVIRRIGYNRAKFGFDCDTCGVMSLIHEQSPDIAQGVDESFETQTGATTDPIDLIGAGDQGMMFGYASNETKTLMPMPHYLASRLAERLAAVRHDGTLPYLRPDGKTQVTVEYDEQRHPVRVDTVVISTQHSPDVSLEQIRADMITTLRMYLPTLFFFHSSLMSLSMIFHLPGQLQEVVLQRFRFLSNAHNFDIIQSQYFRQLLGRRCMVIYANFTAVKNLKILQTQLFSQDIGSPLFIRDRKLHIIEVHFLNILHTNFFHHFSVMDNSNGIRNTLHFR